jgi:DNA-binding NarL/FixJ family response regulator
MAKHPGEALLTDNQWEQVALRFGLTRRELSVARLMFAGKTRSQIGRQLHCAPSTVRTYIDRLFLKLAVKDRLGMALQVIRALWEPGADLSHKNATGEECRGRLF